MTENVPKVIFKTPKDFGEVSDEWIGSAIAKAFEKAEVKWDEIDMIYFIVQNGKDGFKVTINFKTKGSK